MLAVVRALMGAAPASPAGDLLEYVAAAALLAATVRGLWALIESLISVRPSAGGAND